MQNDSSDSSDMQSLSFLFPFSRDSILELRLAQSILAWLDNQTLFTHYYDLIKNLHGIDGYDINASHSLRFNLWMNANACLWAAPYQVKSSNDLLWQFAIIRLSQRLNSGTWETGR